MATTLQTPGVEIIQEFRAVSPTITTPTLVPVIVGPAFEIVEITNSDGTVNSDAAVSGEYTQFPRTIAQSAFPSPRNNITEVNILEDEIEAYFVVAGALRQLENGSDPTVPGGSASQFGEAFLTAYNQATRAALRTTVTLAGLAMDGLILTLALNVVSENDTSQDVSITFPTLGGVHTGAQIAATINTAMGSTVATVIDPGGANECVEILSATYGAGSSVTVRVNSTASAILFPAASPNFGGSAEGYRVEGGGFRGQDDSDGDLETPWIEYFRGNYRFHNGTVWADRAFPAGATVDETPGLKNDSGTFTDNNVPATAVSFSGASPTIPLLAATSTSPGDYFYGDGTQIASGEVIEVQANRFKLGTLDTANSIFDDDGNPTTRVYVTQEVGTIISASPLAPRYAWFQARGLQMNNITPAGAAAALEGTNTGLAAIAAEIESSVATPGGGYSLSGLTLLFKVKVDGVWQADYTYTFTNNYANIAAVAAALTADATLSADLTFTSTTIGANDYLMVQTNETGADQTVTVLSTGTANAVLGFSAAADTTANGKDVEFATQASITSSVFSCDNLSGGEALEITVTDHLGTTTFAYTVTGTPANFTALLADLNGQTTTQIPRFTIDVVAAGANVIDQLIITTREGGAGVSIDTNTNLGVTDPLLGFDDAGPESAAVGSIDCTGLAGGLLPADTLTFTVDALVAGAGPAPVVLTEGIDWTDTGVDQTTSDSIVAAINGDATLGALMVASNAGGTVIPITITIIGLGHTGNLATVVGAGNWIPGADVTTFAGGTNIIGESVAPQTPAADGIAGSLFGFTLDDADCTYEVTAPTNSLDDLIEQINDEVGGYQVASVGSVSARALMLTSPLVGMASSVEVDDATYVTTATALGFLTPNDRATGSGRPNPNFYLDVSGNANVGAQFFRNSITGDPDCPVSSTLYLAYRGLRLDVSPQAATAPGLIPIDDTTELVTVLGAAEQDNPLALGMYFALVNAPTITVSGLGVSAVSGTDEYGTPTAYTEAAEFLEQHEVYGISVLTHDEVVHQTFITHVNAMSASTRKGERILFFNPEVPTERVATTAQSGTGEVSNVNNTFLLDQNPSSALSQNGINPALPIPVSDGVYLEIEINGVNRKYNVSAVSGVALTLNVTFASGENDDGFYSTTTLTGPVPNVDYALKIRGSQLVISGSTLPDYSGIAQTVAAVATAYANRRAYYVFPDECTASLGGPTLNLPGFYMGCGAVGMVGQLPPQQPFTNYPMSGFNGVVGSADVFSVQQLETMQAGGVYIMEQIADGAPISCRHQLSTDTSTIERRELSITKVVDYTAKFMRAGLKAFIGKYNITSAFLDTLGSVVDGQLGFLVENGVLTGGAVNNIAQDADAPDTVLIDVTLNVPYPCNYIRLTLVV